MQFFYEELQLIFNCRLNRNFFIYREKLKNSKRSKFKTLNNH